MDPLILIAIITAFPAFIAAVLSYLGRRDLRTGNGKKVGEIVYELRSEQLKIALALVDADAKVDGVAADLIKARETQAIEATERAKDRQVMLDHIDADAKFQSTLEPLVPAVKRLVEAATTAQVTTPPDVTP